MYSTESGFPCRFLRFNPPRTFIDGPDNWARIQVRKLSEPDSAGNTHRITLAFDSQLAKNMPAALAPCENDLLNGTRFALAWRDEEVADFLDQTWIDGWLRESFLQYASQVENRPEQAIQQALRSFEYQAHWFEFTDAVRRTAYGAGSKVCDTYVKHARNPGRSDSGCRQYAYLRRLDRGSWRCE
ncbi:putative virulence factor [Salmonella enterica subsp. enterica]|uniref:Putative virulence factor n=1 Tax=Salmonella enterica I TaxID=59201 RepID=A0A447U313_SALET|nr:putative virulence factor [Salmonella enterica subsp. enterica]